MSSTTFLDPIARQFIEEVNAPGSLPVYEQPVDEARAADRAAQDRYIPRLPADITDLTFDVGGRQIPLRIVRPKGAKDRLPVIMFFHGGGWVLGDRDVYDRLVRDLASGAQAAVVFVEYSRAPENRYPTAIEECYTATKYVADHGEELELDPSRLAVAGDSAGGNLAAVTCLLAKERGGPEIALQVLFYPVTDSDFATASYRCFQTGYFVTREESMWFWKQYLPDESRRKEHTVAPLQATMDQLHGLPPALIITAEFDILRDEGEAYAHKLIEAGVDVTALRVLGTVHSFVSQNVLAESIAARTALSVAAARFRGSFYGAANTDSEQAATLCI